LEEEEEEVVTEEAARADVFPGEGDLRFRDRLPFGGEKVNDSTSSISVVVVVVIVGVFDVGFLVRSSTGDLRGSLNSKSDESSVV